MNPQLRQCYTASIIDTFSISEFWKNVVDIQQLLMENHLYTTWRHTNWSCTVVRYWCLISGRYHISISGQHNFTLLSQCRNTGAESTDIYQSVYIIYIFCWYRPISDIDIGLGKPWDWSVWADIECWNIGMYWMWKRSIVTALVLILDWYWRLKYRYVSDVKTECCDSLWLQ